MEQSNRDLLAGACLTALGLLIVFALIPMGIVEPSKVKFAALSPSYYPRIVGALLILVGVLIIGNRLVGKTDVTLATTASSNQSPQTRPDAWWRVLIVLITLVAFATLLESLGFMLTSAGVLGCLLLLGGERRPRVVLAISLLTPVLLYYFFVKVPRIPIPNGVLTGIMPGA